MHTTTRKIAASFLALSLTLPISCPSAYALREEQEDKARLALANALGAPAALHSSAAAGLEERPYPPPTPHRRSGPWSTARHFTSLNRHLFQWEWLREHVLPELFERALRKGERRFQVLMFGVSTGEEMARAFHEIATWLREEKGQEVATDPADKKRWQIEVIGFEIDPEIAAEGQAKLRGDFRFFWLSRPDQDNVQHEGYSQSIINTLNRYLPASRKNLRLEQRDLRDAGIARDFPNADLVIVNETLYLLSDDEELPILRQIDSSWPQAWLAMTDGPWNGRRHDIQEVMFPRSTHSNHSYFFGRPKPVSIGGLEEVRVEIPGSSTRGEIFEVVDRIVLDKRLGRIPDRVRGVIRRVIQELLENINEYGYRYARGFKTTLTLRRAKGPSRITVSIQDQTAQYLLSQGKQALPFRLSDLPSVPESAEQVAAIVELHRQATGHEGGLGSIIIQGYRRQGRLSLREYFDPEVGNWYVLTFPLRPARPSQNFGLEEMERTDPEGFFRQHPEQFPPSFSRATDVVTVPIETQVTLYSPDTLAAGLEDLIAKQKAEIPGLQVIRKPLPLTAHQVERPSIVVWDTLLMLAYDPGVPVIRHHLGEPFALGLAQMVMMALLNQENVVGIELLGISEFEQNGRRFLAVAIRTAA